MQAIDTNVLVRLLTRDDEKQVAKAEAFVAKGACVSSLVLTETIWVLESVYDLDAGAIALAVDMLLEHAQLVLQDADAVSLALNQFRANDKVGLTDYLILETARKAGHSPLGTFDKALAKAEGVVQL